MQTISSTEDFFSDELSVVLKALSRYELMEPSDWCHMNEGISFKRNWWCSGEGVKHRFFFH